MTHPCKTSLFLNLVIASTALLTACGGGSSASSTPGTTATADTRAPIISSAPSFSPDVFGASESFEHMCEAPRSGNDLDGDPFLDSAGSTLLEKFWLRSWSEETYLWNDEIIDVDPNSITDRVDYFNILITNELSETGSGEQKDDFHFSEPTEDFFDRRNSAAQSGYGAQFSFIQSSAPRDIRVVYTEPNSPASAIQNGSPNFIRGSRIIAIDGEDAINGSNTDVLNTGLRPENAGETHSFTVRDPGATQDRTFSITSANIVEEPVNRTEIINTDNGRVGYLLFNTFSPLESERSLINAFETLENANVDDLVLDLRYNGGGLVVVAAQLGYMIAGPSRTAGRTASLLQYNVASGNRNPITGDVVEPFPFFDEALGLSVDRGTDLPTVNLPRVFILTTEGTCSASELVINSLRGINHDVILIGDTTCGKPYGFLPTDNCGRTYYTIQFQSVNDQGIGDYSDGFSPNDSTDFFSEKLPGCTISDDLSEELGDENEALLATALYYRENGSCPVSSAQSKPSAITRSKLYLRGEAGDLRVDGDPFEINSGSYLDATRPEDLR